jgi:hypothetical protein
MKWTFEAGYWFLADAHGKNRAIIECNPADRRIWTACGHQNFSKFTHTLEDLQKLVEVLVRLEE